MMTNSLPAFPARALAADRPEGPVHVRWLGTAGFEISFAGTTVLVDPYLSRCSLLDLVRGRLRSRERLLERFLPRADAIVCGHTHFDHVLDVPALARRTGARVFGSRSAVALCRAAGIADERVEDVERAMGQEAVTREVGPFRIRFVPSAHSPLVLGRIPFPGEITDCDSLPMRAERYRCGAVFGVDISVAGRRIYHVGSAEILEAAAKPIEVDLALVCVAGWTATKRFPERVARALSPAGVLLSHWDDFTRPLELGATPLPAIRVSSFVDRMSSAMGHRVHLGALPLFGQVEL